MSPSALVLEIRTGTDRPAVAFAQRTRRDQACLGETLAASQVLCTSGCTASAAAIRSSARTWPAADRAAAWSGRGRRSGIAITLRRALAVGIEDWRCVGGDQARGRAVVRVRATPPGPPTS
jgi:hypothetical protein